MPVDVVLKTGRDVPFEADAGTRYLPWLIGVMLFLFVLSLAAFLALHQAAGQWRGLFDGRVTVQVLPAEGKNLDDRVRKVKSFLQEQGEVHEVIAMPASEAERLLKPWFGDTLTTLDLPLPRLLDVEVKSGQVPDIDNWRKQLEVRIGGVVIDDHNAWLRGLLRFGTSLQMLAGFILAVVTLATVVMMIYTTRTGLAVHREVIEILHLIGAQDRYIAGQFQRHALWMGLRGAMGGVSIGLLTVFLLGLLASRNHSLLLPQIGFNPLVWLWLLLIPLAMPLVMMGAARWTVFKTLRKMV